MNFEVHEKSGTVTGFCLVKSCEKKITVKGLPYLDLILGDKSGEIIGKFWDYNEQVHGYIKADTLIKIKGTISVYNGTDQLRVERVRPVTDADNVDISDFVQSSDYGGEDMFNELKAVTAAFKDGELRLIVDYLLDENRRELLFFPAAFKLHHAMRGGLLYHTLSIVRLAQSVCKIYPCVDADLLLAGVILHDIAKTGEFEVAETGIAGGYSVEGSLVGHLVRGAVMIDAAAQKLGVSKDTALLLEHMVVSHHGRPEFGAAVMPMFLEAQILSELDMLDAHIFEISQTISSVNPGELSSRQWALDNRKLYNHGRKPVEPKAELL